MTRRRAVTSPVVAAPEVENGVGGESNPGHAGHQARHLGKRDRLAAPLREITAEGVVEPACGGCGALGLITGGRRRRARPVASTDSVGDCVGEVPGAGDIGFRQGAPERDGRAARPEQQADGEADRAADRDVFDSNQADLPARRDEDVEQNEQGQGERGLPAANEIAAGASPANRITNGRSAHNTAVFVPIT